jgi:uncharacterized membrane protein YeaQ/YmgE (transglycosylase-associated protein family)
MEGLNPPLVFFGQLRHLKAKSALAGHAARMWCARDKEKGEAFMLAEYGWLSWIIIGGIAGLIAKMLMPGRDPGGCILTILLGIAGAFVAGWLGQAVGWYRQGEGAGFLAAIVGALIILGIYRLIAGRRA